MKLCAIGNSHLAALKQGWNDLAEQYTNIEMTFFGSGGGIFKDMIGIQNNCLIPTTEKSIRDFKLTSSGLTEINFANFDTVILVGLHCSIFTLGPALCSHSPFDVPTDPLSNKLPTISSECIVQTCIDQMETTSMYKVISLIRSISDIPIVVIPAPFQSLASIKTGRWINLSRNASQTLQDSYYDGINKSVNSFPSVKFIPQPINTVTNFIFTKDEFAKGSLHLNAELSGKEDEIDFGHMNQLFGKEVMLSILSLLIK